MTTDLTFFTNEPGATLKDRFVQTLSAVKYFDVLVGYFRSSGFNRLADSLRNVEKIRILVGLNIDQRSFQIIDSVKQPSFEFQSHEKTRNAAMKNILSEVEAAGDDYKTEIGIRKFIEFLSTDCIEKELDLKNGNNGKKLEFRAHPSGNIHAKVYISRYREEQVSYGSVITGSSNFSESGLQANREFNVELKNSGDVNFALDQFEELWKEGVDISEDFVETVGTKTWLNNEISPYELYLKMLYEYFKEDLNIDQEIDINVPDDFMNLQYQQQAIVSAKKILEAYKGVFIADVVGLGKTYICAMLAQQLAGGKLVICPPHLVEYWQDTFFDFEVSKAEFISMGKLDGILEKDPDRYDTIFIDEAHRFRNEYTQMFEKMAEITRGKQVVLVTATPLNNKFNDIFSQIKFFQSPKRSTIPGVVNLENFFKKWERALNEFDRSEPEYMQVIHSGSEEIREKVLKHIMVRRTRSEIKNYFSKDITEQGLFFPEVTDPIRLIYEFNEEIGSVFNETIGELKKFSYSRYKSFSYLKIQPSIFEMQSQVNVGGFMKGILVKRLSSSFYAFKKSVGRFIKSYEEFIEMFDNGRVLISKTVDVYDLLDSDDEEKIIELLKEGTLKEYKSTDFNKEFRPALEKDRRTLIKISEIWKDVYEDPKLDSFLKEFQKGRSLEGKKILVFTESAETGEYLYGKLAEKWSKKVLFFSSKGGFHNSSYLNRKDARLKISKNYDPRAKNPEDELQILISTDVLSEGVNLHRSFSIINYDLPWNPAKVLQRVGRVNRVGSENKEIHIYNFFPTEEADRELNLEDNIKAKIQSFHDTLGEDAKYLTDEEVVGSFELFGDSLYKKMTSKKTYEEEDEDQKSEFEYLKIIRDIRDDKPDLFKKIKTLPKKAQSAKRIELDFNALLTFFRKGMLKKFLFTDGKKSGEIPFFDAVDIFNCLPETSREVVSENYYDFLKKNKKQFNQITLDEDIQSTTSRGGQSNESYVIQRLKETLQHHALTDLDENFIQLVLERYYEGDIPKSMTKRIKEKIEKEAEPLKILFIIKRQISKRFLEKRNLGNPGDILEKDEIVLSEWLEGGN